MLLLLIAATTFTAVTAGVLAACWSLTVESATTRRLRALVPEAAPAAVRPRAAPGRLARGVAALGHALGGRQALAGPLSAAGIRGPHAALVFVGARTLLSLGPALGILVPAVSAGRPLRGALLAAAAAWAIGRLGADLWLKLRVRRRVRRIAAALPDTLDLLVVCLEAGLGLNATIARVGAERAALDDPLGREFAQVALELNTGRSREEALRALGGRNGVEELQALAALIIQSDRLGASMTRTLRVHADLLRTKRRQRAEEAARKLPIKVLLPLALFILPALFVVAAGPALLRLGDLARALGGR
ncbi:MAG TPA: type II secretion system F family protein [Candidatus Binatia bacterium]|nr:type II secretion system F family protein [Candidatus Binatia bacterium]